MHSCNYCNYMSDAELLRKYYLHLAPHFGYFLYINETESSLINEGGCSDKGAARSKKVGGRPFQYLDNEKSLTRKLNGFGTGRSARAQIR